MNNNYINILWEFITFEFAFKFFVVYFFIIWIAIIVWVIKDISTRTNNMYFQILCILIVFILTPLGVFIYLLVRPAKTLHDHYYEEIEENLDIFHEIIEERKKELEKQFSKQKVKKAVK